MNENLMKKYKLNAINSVKETIVIIVLLIVRKEIRRISNVINA